MATFTWTGQGTDTATTNVTIGATDKINFSGTDFDDAITITEYQTSTHIENDSKVEQCGTTHINNTMYVSANSISINGAADEALNGTNLATTECPLEINFAHGSAVALTNVDFYAYDGSTDATGPVGVTTYACEQGDTAWVNTDGSATSHDFEIALSASPDSVGEKTDFSWKMTLTYQ